MDGFESEETGPPRNHKTVEVSLEVTEFDVEPPVVAALVDSLISGKLR